MNRITFLLVLALYCAPAVSAPATNYFVDYTKGNDGNTGLSPGQAWRTVGKVNGLNFSAGDSILFKRGEIWRETLIVPSSGSANNPIVFGAYGSGAKPVFDADSTRSNAIYIDGKKHITLWCLDACQGARESVRVENNSSYIVCDSLIVRDTADTPGYGVGLLFSGCHNYIVRRCEAYNNYWNGFATQTYTATSAVGDCIYEYNKSHDNGHTGFDFQAVSETRNIRNVTFRYNTAYRNAHCGVYIDQEDPQTVSGITIAYCSVYRNGRGGVYIDDNSGSGRTPPFASGVTICNCTCYGNGTTGEVTSPGILGFMQNSTVRNCIFCNNQDAYDSSKIELWLNDGGGTSNTVNYNCLYNLHSSGIISWNGTPYTHSGFQYIGQQANGISVNPLFASADGDDYTLTGSSPCINAGIATGFSKDVAGNTVPDNSAPDIGAYEYQSSGEK